MEYHYPFNNTISTAWTDKNRPEAGVLNNRLNGYRIYDTYDKIVFT